MTAIGSCVVADPPTYTDPTQTAPELRGAQATPKIFQVVTIQLPQVGFPTFTVPMRSEDNGEQLFANFFLDYGSTRRVFLHGQPVSPGTLSDPSDRSISFSWQAIDPTRDAGCHTITALVAHQSSFTSDLQIPDTAHASDVALLTWWVNVVPDPTSAAAVNIAECPSQQPVTTAQ